MGDVSLLNPVDLPAQVMNSGMNNIKSCAKIMAGLRTLVSTRSSSSTLVIIDTHRLKENTCPCGSQKSMTTKTQQFSFFCDLHQFYFHNPGIGDPFASWQFALPRTLSEMSPTPQMKNSGAPAELQCSSDFLSE